MWLSVDFSVRARAAMNLHVDRGCQFAINDVGERLVIFSSILQAGQHIHFYYSIITLQNNVSLNLCLQTCDNFPNVLGPKDIKAFDILSAYCTSIIPI